MMTNISTVEILPFLDTFISLLVNNTIKDPINVSDSLAIIPIKKKVGMNSLIQNKRRINTTLSVNGSRIVPNFETKLNRLATIPSNESLNPTIAINNIKLITSKSIGADSKKIIITIIKRDKVIMFGARKISLIFK